jgi:hypothetical protein
MRRREFIAGLNYPLGQIMVIAADPSGSALQNSYIEAELRRYPSVVLIRGRGF